MNVDELLERTFERHAADAPPADNLTERVQTRLRARRRRLAVLSTLAAVLAIAAVAFSVIQFPRAVPFAGDTLLPGWRWESYGGVEVQVPSSWGYTSGAWSPCFQQRGKPSVVRPTGLLSFVYCTARVPQAKYRWNYVGFDGFEDVGKERLDHGWVRETTMVGGVKLTVATNDAGLRWRILASARRSGPVDVFGCPIGYDFPTPAKGPTGPGLDPSATVESVSVCSYSIQNGWVGTAPGMLVSSSKLEDTQARAVVGAILAAPHGSGPNSPYAGECTSDDKLMGDDPRLLRVHTSAGDVDVGVSFGVCAYRWTFDGKTSRELTKDLLTAILHEPHRLQSYDKWMAHIVPK
jgi:hypothetical protein